MSREWVGESGGGRRGREGDRQLQLVTNSAMEEIHTDLEGIYKDITRNRACSRMDEQRAETLFPSPAFKIQKGRTNL